MKQTYLIISAAIACALPSAASESQLQETQSPIKDEVMRLDVEARADYDNLSYKGEEDNAGTGIQGKYLTLRLDGSIAPWLTYSWRQRFNKNPKDFKATDWIYLNYYIDGWNFQGGKSVVAIGGYEYDRAPIDILQASVFWNNITCYAFGASIGRDITQKDRLTFQVTESPFAYEGMRNMYGYNLMWTGTHGIYESIWTANMMEYTKGKYISYLALGNKFTVGKLGLELDLMNRAASHQTYFFKDCSLMAELFYRPDHHWKIFGKYTYDVNKSGTCADYVVENGTELNMIGGGVEYYPLVKDRYRLRLHAAGFYSWGKNANTANTMQDRTTYITCGLTWNMNIFSK